MAKSVIMPRFGMTQEEAVIVRWLKEDGERVQSGDPLCEVTTDKINMEVECPADGILAGIRYAEGETVPVTEVIAYILAEGESLPEERDAPSPAGALQPSPSRQPGGSRPLSPPEEIQATPVARRKAAAAGVQLSEIQGSGARGQVRRQDVERYLAGRPGYPAGTVRASPAARRLAGQHGVDLQAVKGSGPEGRVQGWDVQAALASDLKVEAEFPAGAPAPVKREEAAGASPGQGGPAVIPLQGMRRTIARRMQASAQAAPHIMLTREIDMGRALALRARANARLESGEAPVSVSALLVKACAAALCEHPLLNSYFQDDRILVMPRVNVGLAVALDEGLIVPVVFDADEKSLLQIAREMNDISQRARQGQLLPQEVVDGTFTLSNLGMFGVDHFTAILNPPQVAIPAAGRVVKRFVPDEYDQPVLRPMMAVTLSVDHRAIDGAGAARFLDTLCGILETAGAQWG